MSTAQTVVPALQTDGKRKVSAGKWVGMSFFWLITIAVTVYLVFFGKLKDTGLLLKFIFIISTIVMGIIASLLTNVMTTGK